MISLVPFALLLATPQAARAGNANPAGPDDPYAWLEDIDGSKALQWVRARNAETEHELVKTPDFEKTRAEILAVLDSEDRLPFIDRMGALYYNFWRDHAHPRGLWRRTTLAQYRKPKPRWETVLDLDALAKNEKENWVWHGADCLRPEYRHCLLFLSRGGADASVVRELDLQTKDFVAGGFAIPEAKTNVDWLDANTLFVGTDWGPGAMTTSGYPRIVKFWRRGTTLDTSELLYEGQPQDVSVAAYRDHTPGFERDFVDRQIGFFSTERYFRGAHGDLILVDVPPDAVVSYHREWMLIRLRTDWLVGGVTYRAGSLLATRFDDYLAGKREITALFAPTPTTFLSGFSWTRHHLILEELENVASRLEVLTPPEGGHGDSDKTRAWQRQPFAGLPAFSSASAYGTDDTLDDEFFSYVEGFLAPPALARGDLSKGTKSVGLKQEPAFFDAGGDEVHQLFATSKDETRVPYFIVAPKGPPPVEGWPTLMTGYGGFEYSLTPHYNAVIGRSWLAHGGAYVVANIRGGGEYGPAWHQAAVRENRPRAYEDFMVVARDMITAGLTSPQRLGIMGGSNGGLLVGNMLTLYPEFIGAVVCQVPLLDMRRYTHLSAGASWIAEYGDPDKPEEWAFLKTFSPYDNLRPSTQYPPVLFTASTRDDRVGPVHARKMTAKMLALGLDVRLYENIEGGHGAAANHDEQAFMSALATTFLWKEVGPKAHQ
jgi:prolyl oligopeptidase